MPTTMVTGIPLHRTSATPLGDANFVDKIPPSTPGSGCGSHDTAFVRLADISLTAIEPLRVHGRCEIGIHDPKVRRVHADRRVIGSAARAQRRSLPVRQDPHPRARLNDRRAPNADVILGAEVFLFECGVLPVRNPRAFFATRYQNHTPTLDHVSTHPQTRVTHDPLPDF
jgi:hypothetical protein